MHLYHKPKYAKLHLGIVPGILRTKSWTDWIVVREPTIAIKFLNSSERKWWHSLFVWPYETDRYALLYFLQSKACKIRMNRILSY